MFKKIISILVLLCFLPATLQAEEAVMKTLEAGQKAPFSGTLLNKTAVADLMIRLNSSEKEFQLKLKKELDIKDASYNFQLEKLKVAHNFEIEVYKSQVQFLNDQVDLSVKQLKKSNFKSDLWFAGGFIVGALLTLGISYATIKIAND
tara:strand:+ start:5232 stop:5675 length:444 start_codon:yes stop_codon:yes gene_type:complete